MKIAVIANSINFSAAGGVGSFIFELSRALLIKHQELLIIGITGNVKDLDDAMAIQLKQLGAQIECLNIKDTKTALVQCIPAAKKIQKMLLQFSTGDDLICNVHLKLATLIGAISGIGVPCIKVIETYHSQYSNYWLQTKVLSPFISMYIACSTSAKDEFIKRFHPDRNKVVAIPNGVDLKKLRMQVTEKKKNESITAISVGRFTNQKNLHVTAEAFSKIERSDFIYKIFGDGNLKQQIKDASGNSDSVKMCGLVPRQTIINELASSDIVVMPSLWEGLSIFMLEAIALGCPMMISDVPSLRDVFDEKSLKNGETWRKCQWGYLVETSNVIAYKDAMLDFLSSKNNKEIMSRNVRNYSKKFDINETASQYLRVYEDILG